VLVLRLFVFEGNNLNISALKEIFTNKALEGFKPFSNLSAAVSVFLYAFV